MKRAVLLLGALCLVAACAGGPEKPRAQKLVYSPNGEPLNGGPLGPLSCAEAMGRWFDRLAPMGGPGRENVGRDAFMADAQAQFMRMDIDNNGALYSEELERFRAPYRSGLEPPDFAKSKEKRKGRGPHGERDEPQERFVAAVDPVMSADANNDFKVTGDEFRKRAEAVFIELDRDRKGALSREDVLRLCRDDRR